MSNADSTGFGKFVPGFDFLQNLAQGATGSHGAMPNFSKWVAPTLDAQEIDKRIEELKTVRFWLEQNTTALSATIQALEVQKMTLDALKGMNFGFGEAQSGAAAKDTASNASAAKPSKAKPAANTTAQPNTIDPLQMWGALTEQFQKIAQGAIKDAAHSAAAPPAPSPASTPAKKAKPKAPRASQRK